MAAADGQIKIRIGAVADRSVETVFGGIEKRALRLRDSLGKALTLGGAKGGNQLERSFGAIERASKKAADGVDKTWNQELARLNRIAKAQDALFERVEANKVRAAEKSARQRERIEAKAAREIERAQRDSVRAAEREASRQERTRRQFAERTSWRATRFMFPPPTGAIDVGRRVTSDILRGAGIDFSLQGSVQRGVSLQAAAMKLANAERIATGSTRGGAAYEALARSTGLGASVDPGNVLKLAERFAAKSGNYADIGKVLPQLVSMATASGVEDFGQVGEAAATAFNQAKGGRDPLGTMLAVMRGTIGQAAEGAIDPADYAKYLSPIASGAFKFQGDRGDNILKLSALAQLAMERGARSPAQAAQSIGSFTSTFGKQARIKAFQKHGVDLFTGANQDEFRDPFEIIKDSFRKTNGNIPALSSMYMDVLGRKPIESLGAVYKQAGGGEAGIAAIQKEFDRYMSKSLTKDTEAKNNADYRGTTGAKAANFQARWDAVFDRMAKELLPTLERLEEPTLKLAGYFATAAKLAADFPFAFLGVIAGATLLRAAMESAARAKLEQMLMSLRAGTPGVPGGPAGGIAAGGFWTGAGGFRGVLNSPGMQMAAPIAAAVAVDLARDQADKFSQENGGQGITDVLWQSASDGSLFSKGLQGMFGVVDAKMNEQAKAEAAARAEEAAKKPTVAGGPGTEAMKPMTYEEMARALADANSRGIRITNLGDIKLTPPAPTVSPDGRTP